MLETSVVSGWSGPAGSCTSLPGCSFGKAFVGYTLKFRYGQVKANLEISVRMNSKQTITSKVKPLMTEKNVTVVGMMTLTGLSNETVMRARDQRIESCSLRTLAAIAGALGVRTKDLYEEE